MMRELQESFHLLLQTVRVTNVCGCMQISKKSHSKTEGQELTVLGLSALGFTPGGIGIFSSGDVNKRDFE